ncbi:hypothetical protein GPK34_00140 [Secundilactobacillus kimchicus]|uniref:Uncharacterized protein n=1 Tax=Secundilactobacillus kimchicus JCM 15530 TaxID=1302272 RepID=A0A0R1HJY4_9LACO|nr:hypothetical protein [Secundilactobacillus kimchicus]KRK46790.1 hypothetical protein FC96_GL000934 [Secundilactobacillus kimchicus JCM 15530]MBT9670445.1 hypothetical protein [Secundilactobacillus kimchicus]
MEQTKREKISEILKKLYGVQSENDNDDVYVIVDEFSKVVELVNFMGSIGAHFQFSAVTDENGSVVDYHFIMEDYDAF